MDWWIVSSLQSGSAEWRAIVEQLSDAVLTMDESHRVRAMNAAAERLFGRTFESMVGRDVGELMPERFRASHGASVEAFARSKEVSRHLAGARIVTGLRADGTEVPLEATVSRTTVDGETRMCIVMRDVSARLELEREVEQFERRLARVGRLEALSTLSAGIAHDFNNTLTVVLSLTRGVMQSAAIEDDDRRDLGEVVKAAQRASELVRRILTLGSGPITRTEDVAPGVSLDDLARICASTAPANVAVTVDLEPVSAIRTDESLFSQALLNLVTNAFYAMKERGGRLHLSLSERQVTEPLACTSRTLSPGRYVRVAVSDTGGGISPEHIARLFEPFFTTKPAGLGTGLGLAMVYGLVSRSQGAIHVTSRPGEGATFELYFPASDGEVPLAPVGGARPAARASYRILLVDDDLFVGAALRRGLMLMGHACHAVSEPRDALALLKSDPAAFDALVADHDMPGLSGVELARACRAESRMLRTFLMSGSEVPPGAEAHDGTFERTFRKPVSALDLSEALNARP
jgi:two-component system, cell cycle sensor histidine kinase and response regulator CckA